MEFRKQETGNYLMCDTPVENIFISEFAKKAPGDYVKVFLVALMYAGLERPVDKAKLASELSLDERRVDEAFDYWRENGLIEMRQKGGDETVEFISIKERLFGKTEAPKAQARSVRLDDKEVAELFRNIEKETGRLLEAKEPEAVATWLKEFGMSPEVILSGYRYCVRNNRSTRYRYVEKVLMDWHERGLDTREKIEEHLEDTDRRYDFYRKVFRIMGFRRNPTEAEKDIMDSWTDRLGLSLEDVREACKKTSGISNPSINYVNSVILGNRDREASEEAEENARLLMDVEARYERIREANAARTAALREKIYTDLPRLREIADEQQALGIRISRNILRGAAGKAELSEARERQTALVRERALLLSGNGYREDALDPVYTCSRCQDTGVLEDGSRCSCYFERLQEVKNGK